MMHAIAKLEADFLNARTVVLRRLNTFVLH